MLEKIQEMLHEEKWTRATLNNYTINSFAELNDIIEGISEGDLMEAKELCDEHIIHTKTSIIGLYISGVISLRKHLIDDSNLIQLTNLFYDNRKWNIVEFLALKVLSYGENKMALKTLAECYDNQGKEEEKFEIWERLVKVDYDETEILKILAERYEENGEVETAIDYYKKCMHRFINKRNFNQIKDIWGKFLDMIPEEYDYLMHVNVRIQKGINKERASQLLEELYLYYSGKKDWDIAIEILKMILSYQPTNTVARSSIITCYKEKYKDHSRLNSYIEMSNLTQSYRDIQSAIEDFEKHISFDEGTFVYHKTWGIGRIKSLDSDSLVIDFASKRDHAMSLQMGIRALTMLPKNHIWVIKSVFPKERLKAKIKKDVDWTLKTIIMSFNNSLSLKALKAELVPSILTNNEWLSWSSNAKKLLKTDPLFSINPEATDEYMVRTTPISYDEKTLNLFKSEKDIYQKVKIVRDFLENSDPDSDYFAEIFSYFTGILKSFTTVNDTVVTSFLFVQKLMKNYPFLTSGVTFTFKEMFDEIDHAELLFEAIKDTELKRSFLDEVKKCEEEWAEFYKRMFRYYQSSFILDTLFSGKQKEIAFSIFKQAYDSYKEDPDTYLWLVKNYSQDFWTQKIGITYDRVIISLIHLLDLSYRAIDNKKDVSKNRKLSKTTYSLLFDEGALLAYFKICELSSIQRIYPLINEMEGLTPARKIEVKHIIKERYPDFIFPEDTLSSDSISGGLLVTLERLKDKEKELAYITEVAIPENSKEIGEARLLGDLKENAEYIAGKERQELLNISLGKLKEELTKAIVFDPKNVNIEKISFGTKVTLMNRKTDTEETYTILGPWESNPSKNIISYLAPFGAALLNSKSGENLDFVINERAYAYTVLAIESALS